MNFRDLVFFDADIWLEGRDIRTDGGGIGGAYGNGNGEGYSCGFGLSLGAGDASRAAPLDTVGFESSLTTEGHGWGFGDRDGSGFGPHPDPGEAKTVIRGRVP